MGLFPIFFEENYFQSIPLHGGSGLLNLSGIAKRVYDTYQLLKGLGNKHVSLDGAHAVAAAAIQLKRRANGSPNQRRQHEFAFAGIPR